MNIRLIYRNYKPLHKIHESLVRYPPAGVKYFVKKPHPYLGRFLFVYKKFREKRLVKLLISFITNRVFLSKHNEPDIDIYHYVNVIDKSPPTKPYVVDMEHVGGLFNFTNDATKRKEVLNFMKNNNCRAVICLTQAAKRTLKELLTQEQFKRIKSKINVTYPAVVPVRRLNIRPDYQYIPNKKAMTNLLFVGSQAYLKGLEELLIAIGRINQAGYQSKLKLHIVSGDAEQLLKTYNLPNVFLYPPSFSRLEILAKFFIPADAFILPTKEDTFGMVILDALSSGTPVIATNQFAIAEMVTDGRDGLLLNLENPLLDRVLIPSKQDMDLVTRSNPDYRLASEIETKIKLILDGAVDLEEFGLNGLKKFTDGGRFAIATRNKQLLKLYKDILV